MSYYVKWYHVWTEIIYIGECMDSDWWWIFAVIFLMKIMIILVQVQNGLFIAIYMTWGYFRARHYAFQIPIVNVRSDKSITFPCSGHMPSQ